MTAFKELTLHSCAISRLLAWVTRSRKGASHALHFTTSMPPTSSPSSFVRSSVWLIAAFRSEADFRISTMFNGNMMTSSDTATQQAAPSCWCRRNRATAETGGRSWVRQDWRAADPMHQVPCTRFLHGW